jgi:hypothetical protein
MLTTRDINKEHKKAVVEMRQLVRAAQEKGEDFPAGHDYDLYSRLTIIKDVLEWVNNALVTTDPNGRNRITQLMGDSRYYGMGPVVTEMIKRRL